MPGANSTPPIQYHQSGGQSFTDASGSLTYTLPNPFASVITSGKMPVC